MVYFITGAQDRETSNDTNVIYVYKERWEEKRIERGRARECERVRRERKSSCRKKQ